MTFAPHRTEEHETVFAVRFVRIVFHFTSLTTVSLTRALSTWRPVYHHPRMMKVIVTHVDTCIKHIIRHTRFPRQLKEIEYRVKHTRSKDMRVSIGSYVLLMLQKWPAASMDKEAAHLEAMIEVMNTRHESSWALLTAERISVPLVYT